MNKKEKKPIIVGSFNEIIKASVSGNPKPKPKNKVKKNKKNNPVLPINIDFNGSNA